MKIGIIGGTGGMGKGFALRWCKNNDVIVGSRDAGRASDAAKEYTDLAKETYGDISGSISGNDTEVHYNDGQTPPTDAAIDAELKRLQSEYEANKYQRDRADAYPSIQEQLDMQYWDAVNGTKKWQEAVAKVKTDNPKPE